MANLVSRNYVLTRLVKPTSPQTTIQVTSPSLFIKRYFTDGTSLKSTHKDRAISRYPTHNIKELPIPSQEKMYHVDDKSGFIPNLYLALAYRPEQFERFIQYRNAIMRRDGSNLKKEDLEFVGLVASLEHDCMYCTIAHSALHRVFSKDKFLADQVVADLKSADLSPRQRAIASLATAVAKCQQINDHQFNELQKQGLTMDDAWDIASMASFTSMTNGLIKFLNVKPNQEYFALGRQ